MVRRVLLVVMVLGALLFAGGAFYLGPIGPIATGYAAQIGCGAHVISGRPLADVVANDLPDNPLVPFLRVSADGPIVTATLLGAYDSVSVRTADGGCRLVDASDASGLAASDAELVVPLGADASADDDLVLRLDPAAEARAAGFDVDRLAQTIDAAFAEDADEATTVGTRAVVVLQGNTLIAEQYADGFDADTPLLGWSMAKSVANMLAGNLVQRGLVDMDTGNVWPGWDAGDARNEITLAQLLQMTSGLRFEEVYDPGTDATELLFRPRDTAAFTAAKTLDDAPGTRWSYSSGSTNLLCDALVRIEGADAQSPTGGDHALAVPELFRTLNMRSATMGTDTSGDPVCSSFAYATARDWARFGLLYAQDGVWGGEQVLPDGWVDWSVTPAELETENPYGAGFWLNAGPRITAGETRDVRMPSVPLDAFWASGNEGQHVVIIPSLDLVVVRLGLTRGYSGIEWGLEPLLAGIVDSMEGGS